MYDTKYYVIVLIKDIRSTYFNVIFFFATFRTVDPKRALPRPERETRETNISVKKLFVGGLKDNHDEKCLEEYFSKFGNVISVKILTDRTTGKRRGFAFIEYDDYDSVDKAIRKYVFLKTMNANWELNCYSTKGTYN